MEAKGKKGEEKLRKQVTSYGNLKAVEQYKHEEQGQ